MDDLPGFMKRRRVPVSAQNTQDVEGYYYDCDEDAQIAIWTAGSDRTSERHRHDFEEYMIVINGRYIAYIEGEKHDLAPGDGLFIPKGKEQWGECIAGTRTIHFFGGKRIPEVGKK